MLELLNKCSSAHGHIHGDDFGRILADSKYSDIMDFIPDTDNVAIIDPLVVKGLKLPLTHRRLKQFARDDFNLEKFHINDGDRISIFLPNGAEAAVVLICVLKNWCAAPISPTSTLHEITSEMLSAKSKCLIIQKGFPPSQIAIQAAESIGLGIVEIESDEMMSGLFTMRILRPMNKSEQICKPTLSNHDSCRQSLGHPENVLLIHTSGTSGNKKLVPYSLDTVMVGVGCIISSWCLTETDVCLNMVSACINYNDFEL